MDQVFKVQKSIQQNDGMGGVIQDWVDVMVIRGYLDLMSGSNQQHATHNAQIEASTHILIIPEYQDGLTDKMRITDQNSRKYTITYVDNPVGVNHHLEIYLKFVGDTT